MFSGLQPTSPWTRRYGAVGSSVAAHLLLLILMAFVTRGVIDITPTWLARGEGSHTYQITYIAPGTEETSEETPQSSLPVPSSLIKPRPRPKQVPKTKQTPLQVEANAEASDRNSHAGSSLGTVLDGPISGHEVHVAYPTIYPDPPVDRAGLPRDLVGDVVIEVTIDSQGNVVETKIVQAIGHGLDEKIEATLRRWHYQPATLDGTPVASRHDVHFHFPS
jgi:TonB family protein